MRPVSITARRTFLKNCWASAVLFAAGDGASLPKTIAQVAALPSARVVVARDSRLRGSGSAVDAARMLQLLDRTMEDVFRTSRAVDAWTRVARPGQRVALKVNSLGGRGLSTNSVLVEAVCERMQGREVAIVHI